VLSSPNVDALVVTMTSPVMVDEYVGASGWTMPARADAALLERYVALNDTRTCRVGCDACAAACPAGVAVGDVLRTRMYAVDYGDAPLGRAEYALLHGSAAACARCSATPCTSACPHDLAVPTLTRQAHRLLA
jgi:predicted aldo/keto reductase-like oxidoreductase